MLRVPGSSGDLSSVKAAGGDLRIVYSPLDAVRVAQENLEKEVVFFAIGFETTAPANAMAVLHANGKKIGNFSILVSQFRVPPAIEAILSSPQCAVDGFLAAGHVCAVMGTEEYVPIAAKHSAPIVVTGFEPVDILRGISACIRQLEQGRSELENAYLRTVRDQGNPKARETIDQVFQVTSGNWRGIGEIPNSGLRLRGDYAEYDAEKRFQLTEPQSREPSECMSGLILQGILKPNECPEFGKRCTPQHPLGATMVSSEGACAAYYQYRTSHEEECSR
jgi:hydrogenase expression/formation protein HypD